MPELLSWIKLESRMNFLSTAGDLIPLNVAMLDSCQYITFRYLRLGHSPKILIKSACVHLTTNLCSFQFSELLQV